MSEKMEDCPKCGEERSLERVPLVSTISYRKEEKIDNKKVGDITREFIESAKQDLQEQKKEIKEEREDKK